MLASMYQMSQPGNMVMWEMPVFPWFTKQNMQGKDNISTSSCKTNAEILQPNHGVERSGIY